MLTSLWEVKLDYTMSYGGMTYHTTFYVSGRDMAEATLRAVRYVNGLNRFDKEIMGIKKFSDSYCPETSVD